MDDPITTRFHASIVVPVCEPPSLTVYLPT